MSSPSSLPYHSIPQNKLQRKQASNWSGRDAVALLISLLLVAAAFVWFHPFVGVIVTFTVMPLNIRYNYGRMYREIAIEFKGAIIESLLDNTLWTAEERPRFESWLRRVVIPDPIPFSLGLIRATIDEDRFRVGVLHQRRRRLDHIFIAADGGDFASMDVAARHEATDQLDNAINQVILASDLKIGVSHLRITGPADPTAFTRMLAVNGNPVIFRPEVFDVDPDTAAWADWMRKNANQIRPTMQMHGASKQWLLVVLTVKRNRAARRARKGKLGDKEIYDLPIVDMGRSVVEALETLPTAGLVNVRLLGLAELSQVVRSSWDTARIGDYYRDLASGAIPSTDDEIDAILESAGDDGLAVVSDALRAWPERIISVGESGKFSYMRLDDNYIGVMRGTAMPETVRVDQFTAIHHAARLGEWTRVAQVGQTVSGTSETKQMVVQESALVNAYNAFMKSRVVQDPRFGLRRKRARDQAAVLAQTKLATHWNPTYATVAPSPPKVEQVLKKARGRLAGNGFMYGPIRSSGLLRDAVWTAILGCNRL